jgi:hypothetical protein
LRVDHLVFDGVHDVEFEAAKHVGVDDEASGVHRVGEHAKHGVVEATCAGFVRGEDDNRVGAAFLNLHLRHARVHAAYVAAER